MTSSKFRRPSEMEKDEELEPLSVRVRKSTKAALERAARENHLSLALLVSNVLDDYVTFLKSTKPERG
mgnify:CR=1 FL=1